MAIDQKLTNTFLSIRNSLTRAVREIVPPAEVEDVVQETYVRVCQSRGNNEIRSPRSFMYKTARNIAINHANRAESKLNDPFDDSETLPESLSRRSSDTLDKVCTDEEFAHLCEAVRQLPPKCRCAFVLKKVYGHSQREIGELLSISEKTVESHIAIGAVRCRDYMKNLEQTNNTTDRAAVRTKARRECETRSKL